MTDIDHRPAEVREQAQRHADRARASMQDKRAKRTVGWAAGWPNGPAMGPEGQDEAALQRQKFFWNVLVDYWFRMEIDGWENIPETAGAVDGHSLGRSLRLGRVDRRDPMVATLRPGPRVARHRARRVDGDSGIGRYFRSMGVLPAAPDAIATALAEGRDVALWPGGEVDSLRPWTERDRANLAGRKGFVKMAIRAGRADRADRDRRRRRRDAGADPRRRAVGACNSTACYGSRFFRWRSRCPGGSRRRLCRSCRCRPRSGPGSCRPSSSTMTRNGQRTTVTSTANTARFKTAFNRGWMRWRASARYRFLHNPRRPILAHEGLRSRLAFI